MRLFLQFEDVAAAVLEDEEGNIGAGDIEPEKKEQQMNILGGCHGLQVSRAAQQPRGPWF